MPRAVMKRPSMKNDIKNLQAVKKRPALKRPSSMKKDIMNHQAVKKRPALKRPASKRPSSKRPPSKRPSSKRPLQAKVSDRTITVSSSTGFSRATTLILPGAVMDDIALGFGLNPHNDDNNEEWAFELNPRNHDWAITEDGEI